MNNQIKENNENLILDFLLNSSSNEVKIQLNENGEITYIGDDLNIKRRYCDIYYRVTDLNDLNIKDKILYIIECILIDVIEDIELFLFKKENKRMLNEPLEIYFNFENNYEQALCEDLQIFAKNQGFNKILLTNNVEGFPFCEYSGQSDEIDEKIEEMLSRYDVYKQRSGK